MNLRHLLHRWRKASADRVAAPYEIVVYFNGPKTQWSGKIAAHEIIARHPSPFLWLARWRASAIFAGLNQDRCGYVVMRGADVLVQVEPPSDEPIQEPAR